jgi:hypothetical protein
VQVEMTQGFEVHGCPVFPFSDFNFSDLKVVLILSTLRRHASEMGTGIFSAPVGRENIPVPISER